MQRLEVSGAVRPLYGSLGVKGLMNMELCRLIFEKQSNIKFEENPPLGAKVFKVDGQRDGQT